MFASMARTRDRERGPSGQLFVMDADALTSAERGELPEATLALFLSWEARLGELPASLAWARDELRARKAVLERACFDEERVHWCVRFPLFGNLELLERPAFGADGLSRTQSPLPQPLGWLTQTFGTVSLAPEESGTAPFGWSVDAMRRNGGFFFAQPDSPPPPPESDAWVALYEADGDVLVADLEDGGAFWLGHEWTGDALTDMQLRWDAAAEFIFWRLLDGGHVRPSDLSMLSSVTTRR